MSFDPQAIYEDPGDFHARAFDTAERSLWVPQLSAEPTLVLGSSQSANDVDHDALRSAGIGLTSRRSGGGAVLVSFDDLVWFDIVLPSTDPLWDADVGRSFDWLGTACQRALRSLDVETERHTGSLVSNEWSRKICFASLGPGELTVDGKKLVGMSQRRTRQASRIQVAILRRWDGEQHAQFLDVPGADRARAAADLEHAAFGIPHSPTEIMDAVTDELQTIG